MTLATRCPACGTAFRVVSDQLRVSSGWVRCGRCGTSFDALEHLFRHASTRKASVDEPPERMPSMDPGGGAAPGEEHSRVEEAPPPGEEPSTGEVSEFEEAPPIREAAPTGAAASTEEASAVEQFPPDREVAPVEEAAPVGQAAPIEDAPPGAAPSTEGRPAEETPPAPTPSAADLDVAPARLQPVALDAAARVAEPGAPAPGTPTSASGFHGTDAAETASADPGSPVAQADLGWARHPGYRPRGRPAFLRRAEAAARWAHPATRTTLALLLVILAVLLWAQAALLWRDEIALRWPASRPVLEAACASLQCRIEAPRRIQALAVESSDLRSQPDGATYRLEVAIRNRGAVEVLMPALELTLTDAAGQLYARRVLSPGEIGSPSLAIAAGQEFVLQAELVAGSSAVAGYTIALFYP